MYGRRGIETAPAHGWAARLSRDPAILNAALSALADHGFNDTNMNDIAARAGVGKAAIYRRWASIMKGASLAAIAAIAAAAVALAAPAHADRDTDFADQLHPYGIYGPRDYNAWLAKIICERLHAGVDADADESAHFVSTNLPRGTTQVQTWQFLGTALIYYCPDQTPVLQR